MSPMPPSLRSMAPWMWIWEAELLIEMQQVFICGWRNQAQEYRSCLMLQEGGQRLFEQVFAVGKLERSV
jgi:hypothetical protein